MDVKDVAAWLSVIGWFITGLWFVRQHLKRRDDYARIDLTTSMRQVANNDEFHVVEVIAEVENTGSVRHYIKDLTYTIRGSDMEDLDSDPSLLHQVKLPLVVARNSRFFPDSWEYSFVDAGQTSKYRHLILVPRRIKLFQVVAKMRYEDKSSDFHTATWFGTL